MTTTKGKRGRGGMMPEGDGQLATTKTAESQSEARSR